MAAAVPTPAVVRASPLPRSVRREATEPTIVTSRPSRIHTVPRPKTILQWNRDHGRRSRRAGTAVRTVRSSPVTRRNLISHGSLPPGRPSLPLRERRQHDAVALRTWLRRRGREALPDGGGRRAVRPRSRPRGHGGPGTAGAAHRAAAPALRACGTAPAP